MNKETRVKFALFALNEALDALKAKPSKQRDSEVLYCLNHVKVCLKKLKKNA